jgi:hypothetical protein
VHSRHEAGFVRRGREVHAALQHFVEEAIEALAVALHDLGKAERRRRAEIQAEHAADALGGERHAGLLRFAGESFRQRPGGGLDSILEVLLLHELQGRQPRSHRHRIAGQRAGLVDRAQRRDLLHDVAPAADRAHRQAAADDLAQRGEVRPDAVARLRAAEGDAKPGHHLVEDQHRAVLRA